MSVRSNGTISLKIKMDHHRAKVILNVTRARSTVVSDDIYGSDWICGSDDYRMARIEKTMRWVVNTCAQSCEFPRELVDDMFEEWRYNGWGEESYTATRAC